MSKLVPFSVGVSPFVLDVTIKHNVATITISAKNQAKSAEINSVLATLRKGAASKLFIKPNDAVVLSDTFSAVTFRLFQIGGKAPIVTKTLTGGITIEDGGIMISLPSDDMTTTGDHYFDITVTQSTPIVLLDGRLKILNGR